MSENSSLPQSRFRLKYRDLSDDEKRLSETIKVAFEEVEYHLARLKDSRYKALALTALEESCMWAIKQLTS